VQQKIVRRPGKGSGKGPTGPITTPSADVLVMMVRATLAGVNQANFTENYSVLHGMTTPGLQTRVTPAQFGKAFGSLRKQNLDLSPALVLQPQFSAPPSVSPQGVLRVAGFFPSRPLQINFAIDYLPIDGFWLIDGLSVSAMQVPADASAPASVSAPAPAPAPVASLAAPAKPAAATAPQRTMTFARFGFWEPRFTKTTQFGPGLRFASSP
jgi:hypothetical protein